MVGMNWTFIDTKGTFNLKKADETSYLYFPLANESGMMSAITPFLGGDLKTGQKSFLLQPVSIEDLHNNRSSRNFWLNIKGYGPWSATGNSAHQISSRYYGEENTEDVEVKAGFLWHKVIRESHQLNIRSEITNFVPVDEEQVELMKVSITNTGNEKIEVIPVTAIPIYGRSADNLRDHRHVTSLLHRTTTTDNGVTVKDALSFDERGHTENDTIYAVMGSGPDGSKPVGFYPILQDFIGEGGTLDWPRAIVEENSDFVKSGCRYDGYESMGGLRFREETLEAGGSLSYIIIMAIDHTGSKLDSYVKKYSREKDFDKKLEENKEYWQSKIDQLTFYTGDETFDNWMKWINLQPILRRIYGCSFLPYHDYGRGGKGWRDLWQDCLALLLINDPGVHDLLYNNFAGVRIDGSNATIIGSKQGDFTTDRNNISRMWMDHGAWPLQTTSLYINLTGNLRFLLEDQTYFKDGLISFTRELDEQWNLENESDNILKDNAGLVYQGTILEHLLLENLTAFFNVGEHNNIRLEDADWNDALDMASENGESVAFTAFYAGNLLEIVSLLKKLREEEGITEIELLEEIRVLLDPVDYDNVGEKNRILSVYFKGCKQGITGKRVGFSIDILINNIENKAEWMVKHLREAEWTGDGDGFEWFNGYYDNNGLRVGGAGQIETRMTLTGQVFTTMFGIATEDQVERITRAADKYLFDKKAGGYRLNTEFQDKDLELGRCFGFAYGHKENGAMFSHMSLMYANALYKRGFVKEGYRVWKTIYEHCQDFKKSRIFPGIPEYVNNRGRGLYTYLTGSASWLLLTMVSEVFGVKGVYGDLKLEPKLLPEQFDDNGRASIGLNFSGRKIQVEYLNNNMLDYPEYKIKKAAINKQVVMADIEDRYLVISREDIELLDNTRNIITVELG